MTHRAAVVSPRDSGQMLLISLSAAPDDRFSIIDYRITNDTHRYRKTKYIDGILRTVRFACVGYGHRVNVTVWKSQIKITIPVIADKLTVAVKISRRTRPENRDLILQVPSQRFRRVPPLLPPARRLIDQTSNYKLYHWIIRITVVHR